MVTICKTFATASRGRPVRTPRRTTLDRYKFPFRLLHRAGFESDHQASVQRFGDATESLDARFMLATFNARDSGVARADQGGQLLLGQVVLRAELDDQARDAFKLAQPSTLGAILRTTLGTPCGSLGRSCTDWADRRSLLGAHGPEYTPLYQKW